MALTRRQELLYELEVRTNKDLLPAILNRLGLSKAAILEELQALGAPTGFETGTPLHELDKSVQLLERRNERRSMIWGSLAALGGAFTLTPEALAEVVFELRRSQRLSVVFGFDPKTPLGELLVWGSLAEAYRVKLPQQTRLGVDIRSFGQLTQTEPAASSQLGVTLELILASLAATRRKPSRVLPILGAGSHALELRRQRREKHQRMAAHFREAWLERHGELRGAREASEV